MLLECNEECVHLDKVKSICKEWFRHKLEFTVKKLPDGTNQKTFIQCEECRAIDDDELFAEIMRRESLVCKI